MAMRREGRIKGSFSRWNHFFENNGHTTCFNVIFTKTYSRKNDFRFSQQNTCKLKDLKLFKVPWTTYYHFL